MAQNLSANFYAQRTSASPLRKVLCAGLLLFALHAYGQEAKFLSFLHDTHIADALICSPDGKNVYASGIHTIAVFARQADGSLKTIQVLNNEHGGVKGIFHVIDLVVSSEGRHLYALNVNDQSLLLFHRDTATGMVALQKTFRDSVFGKARGTEPVLEKKYKLLLSPDGRHLYWFYSGVGLIAVFERNSATGQLKKIQVLRNGAPELGGFNVPWWVVISPDGKNFYGGGGSGTKMLILSRDLDHGAIAFSDYFDMGPSPEGNWQYGSISIAYNGKNVFVTDLFDDKFFVLIRDEVNGKVQSLQVLKPNAPYDVIISPNSKQVYLRYYDGANYFALYENDVSSGQLLLINARALQYDSYPPLPPSGTCISPIGETIYITSDVGRTVIQRNTTSGALKIIQHFEHNVGGTDHMYSARSVAVSPNGKRLYVGARFSDAGINTFDREPQTGVIQLAHFDSLPNAQTMVLSPDGRFLYASTHASSPERVTLETFAIDPGESSLQWLDSKPTVHYWPLTFSPQAEHLYVGNKVFNRDPSSGLLTEIQTVDGRAYQLGAIHASAVSPEGKHFYWLGEQDYSQRLRLGIFARDSLSGQLSFLSRSDLGAVYPGDIGAGYAAATILISPDGRHAYAATLEPDPGCESCDGQAVLRIFTRNSDSGALALIDKIAFPRWCELRDLELTASGDEVYALLGCSGYYSGEIVIFTRDAGTGKLTKRASLESWKNGAYGIISPRDLTLSPDEIFFYVTDPYGLATFTTGRKTTSIFATPSFVPRSLVLEQNYPNPFTASASSGLNFTKIRYEVPSTSKSAVSVELAIYNLQGQLVSKLVDAAQATGHYTVVWEGAGANAETLPAGIYFYRLKAGEQVMSKRLLLIR